MGNLLTKRSLPFLICGLAAFFYPYEFMVRVMPSAMTHDLMQTFHIDAAGLGVLSSLFYYGYTTMQVPAGLLFDRFGPRLLLSFAMLICSLGTLWFGLTDNFYVAAFARFLIGFGSSFAFIGTLVLAARWFAPQYFALIAGLVQFLGSIGALVGQQPIAELIKHYTWQDTVYWTAIIGVGISILMWLIIRDHPYSSSLRKQETSTLSMQEKLTGFKIVYKNPQTWWIAAFGFCSWAPITIFAALWGIPFLMSLYHVDAGKAASGMTVLWLGVAIGSPLVGWWSDHIHRRCLPLALCAAVAFISSIAIIYTSALPWWSMYVLLFVFGLAAASQSLSFGLVQDNNPPQVAGSAIGFNNMAVVLGGMICQPLVGYFLKLNWSGTIAQGVPYYSVADYRYALWLVPLVSLVGFFIAWLKLKETFCRQVF